MTNLNKTVTGQISSIAVTLIDIGARSYYLVGRDTKRMRLVQVKYISERVIGFADPAHKGKSKPFVIEKTEVEARVRQIVIVGEDTLNYKVKITPENFSDVSRAYSLKSVASGILNKYGIATITKIFEDEIFGKTIYNNQYDITIDDVVEMVRRSHVYFRLKPDNDEQLFDYFRIDSFNPKGMVKLSSVVDDEKYEISANDLMDKLNDGDIAITFNIPSALREEESDDVGVVEQTNSGKQEVVPA